MDRDQQTADEFLRLVRIMRKLRGEGGCPWDKEQTHQTLRPYLIEEAYEVLEAIDENNMNKLKEELGDLLLQIVFHAQIAMEEKNFELKEIIMTIADKLERRHPHVFGNTMVNSVESVLTNWEKIKSAEKPGERSSILDGIPRDLPALQYAEKIQSKAAKVGFEWADVNGAWRKVHEEADELRKISAEKNADISKVEEEVGDLLFAVVNVARFLKVHPEQALRKTINKFNRRFRFIEETAKKTGKNLALMDLMEMDELWEKAKALE